MMLHINIGSNLGDREANVDAAAKALSERLGVVSDLRRAPLEYSPAWGYESRNDYVNLGIAFDDCSLSPREILLACREVELTFSHNPHRNPDGTYADRLLDIDIIAIGDMSLVSPELVIPHPRMHLRPFVLRPLAALDPAWRHPILGLTAAELLSEGCP